MKVKRINLFKILKIYFFGFTTFWDGEGESYITYHYKGDLIRINKGK